MKIILFILITLVLLVFAFILWYRDKKSIGRPASEYLEEKLNNWNNLSRDDAVLIIKYKISHFLYRLFLQFMFLLWPLIIFFGIIVLSNSDTSFGIIILTIIGIVMLLTCCIHLIPHILYPKFYFYKDRIVMKRLLLSTITLNYYDIGFYTEETTGINILYQGVYIFKVLKKKENLYKGRKNIIKIYAGYLFHKQINDLFRLIQNIAGVYHDFNTMGTKTTLEPLMKN